MESYAQAGVDYDVLDRVKRLAQGAATSTTLSNFSGVWPRDESRGESAHVTVIESLAVGSVLECLGTKSTIAREVHETLGIDRYAEVGYDTVAAAVNDLVAVGFLPVIVNAYFAAGSVGWFADESRTASLIEGFRAGCADSGAAWGGGETPVLSGIVSDGEIDLAASAWGLCPGGRSPLLGEYLKPGDDIVLVASTGLHTNGATLARHVASELPDGWATPIADGERAFGEAVLDRSANYARMLRTIASETALLAGSGSSPTYAAHITGHGFRKIMRSPKSLTYRITQVPPVPPVLRFLADAADLSPREAYGTFNMGAGFALFCGGGQGRELAEFVASGGYYEAVLAGVVEEGPRQVIVEPIDVTYSSDELELR